MCVCVCAYIYIYIYIYIYVCIYIYRQKYIRNKYTDAYASYTCKYTDTHTKLYSFGHDILQVYGFAKFQHFKVDEVDVTVALVARRSRYVYVNVSIYSCALMLCMYICMYVRLCVYDVYVHHTHMHTPVCSKHAILRRAAYL